MRALAVRAANELTPPALLRFLRRLRGSRYGFFGQYPTFAEAAAACGEGYADPEAIATQIQAQRETNDQLPGMADDRWLQLQLALSHALDGAEGGSLRVLDFGGGAGTHYFETARRRGLSGWPRAELEWHVCETAPMTAAAQAAFGGRELSFHASLEPLEGKRYDLVYVSGSLQYVPDPHAVWSRLAESSHRWLALNRTPFVAAETDVFAVQRAPLPGGGETSYPGRFLAAGPWLERLSRTHDVVTRWPVREPPPYMQRIRDVRYEGMLLRRRSSPRSDGSSTRA